MYMYPIISPNTSAELSPTNTNTSNFSHNTRIMPRNRSSSVASATNSPPALISRGFASLRRASRRLSTSSPSSPAVPSHIANTTTSTSPNNSNINTSAHSAALEVRTDETSLTRSLESSNSTNSAGSNARAAESNSTTQHAVPNPRIRLVPNVGLSNRSFVFEVIERDMEPGSVYRIGRFSERNALPDRLSFKSKVVSRSHSEIWAENGKVYLRDIGSSSGTFLNRERLSSPNHTSQPFEVKDGDAIQLGVDYQGGLEPIYRAVRIRAEINRPTMNPNSPFARTAFQQLRSHLIGVPISNNTSATAMPSGNLDATDSLVQPGDLGLHREPTKVHEHSDDIITVDPPKQLPLAEMLSRDIPKNISRADIQECCICLYAIAPFQALFIAPCSHIFHFKCLRPIVFQNYPGFSCPLCRSYFDLEASVAVEVDEVLEAFNEAREKQQQQQQKGSGIASPIDTVPELNEDEEDEDDNQASASELVSESSNNHSEVSLNENHGSSEQQTSNSNVIKNNINPLSTIPTKSTPITYGAAPGEEVESSSSNNQQQQNTSASRDICTNSENIHLQARNGEGLLSRTLVGSPTMFENVLNPASS